MNYSDTGKYADGTDYDGTIQSQKKILMYTTPSGTVSYEGKNYQCTSATGRLNLPQKYLLEVVVEPISGSGTTTFSNITPDSNGTITGTQAVTARRQNIWGWEFIAGQCHRRI